MVTTAPATTPTTAGSPAATATGTSKSQLNGDLQTFLKMLTTQIKNQDPLNPVDSSDFAVQLATFSGVEQQVQTNKLLSAMTSQLGMSGMSQMAGWVGMEARVSEPVAFDGTPVTLMPEPAAGADQAVVVVMDASKREILSQPVTPSTDPLVWAGTDQSGNTVAMGTYSFRLDSYANGQIVSSSTLDAYGKVNEIRSGTDGASVVLDGGSIVPATAVKALRAATAPATAS